MSDYTSVSVTNEAREALRRLTATITGLAGQRVSMSDALLIADRIVTQNAKSVVKVATDLEVIDSKQTSRKGS